MNSLKGRNLKGLQCLALAGALLTSGQASAGFYNDGKVLLTGGVFTVDGAGGGGAVPWATITGYETRDGVNGGIGFTYVQLPNYELNFFGGAIGFYDRFELSYVNTKLSTSLPVVDLAGLADKALGLDLGLDPFNSQLHMHTYGAKLRLFGDAVYTADTFIPQTAIGFLYKENTTGAFTNTLGAADDSDYEIYLAFTKVLFPISTLVNITARYTAANQIGLTGFGVCNGSGANEVCEKDREVRFELSVAHLLAKNFAIGFEIAQHGDNLDGRSVNAAGIDASALGPLLGGGLQDALTQQEESDWYDFFFAYAPSKNYSITMAYLMLGNIAVAENQNGFYISLHTTF